MITTHPRFLNPISFSMMCLCPRKPPRCFDKIAAVRAFVLTSLGRYRDLGPRTSTEPGWQGSSTLPMHWRHGLCLAGRLAGTTGCRWSKMTFWWEKAVVVPFYTRPWWEKVMPKKFHLKPRCRWLVDSLTPGNRVCRYCIQAASKLGWPKPKNVGKCGWAFASRQKGANDFHPIFGKQNHGAFWVQKARFFWEETFFVIPKTKTSSIFDLRRQWRNCDGALQAGVALIGWLWASFGRGGELPTILERHFLWKKNLPRSLTVRPWKLFFQ